MPPLDSFLKQHPYLFHMAWKGAFDSIMLHGLLSTQALLDLYEVDSQTRECLLSKRRPNSVIITHEEHGKAVIRDQKPLSDVKLNKCLTGGLSTDDWYRILNERVFFWTTKERLFKLMNAAPYRDDSHCVLVLDTQKLYSSYGPNITFSPINSGATMFPHTRRGNETFSRFEDFPYESYRSKRPRYDIFVELTVAYKVQNIANYLVSAYIMNSKSIECQLYPSIDKNFSEFPFR